MSDEQRLLYISGFQKLRKNGQLSSITTSYSKLMTSMNRLQDSSLFFLMDEHLVYEFEAAIRSLGTKYECFAMPYWPFTMDAGMEDNAPIFNTGLGGDGDKLHKYCVTSDRWNLCNDDKTDELCYWTPFMHIVVVPSTTHQSPIIWLLRTHCIF